MLKISNLISKEEIDYLVSTSLALAEEQRAAKTDANNMTIEQNYHGKVFIRMPTQAAAERELTGWVVTLDIPAYLPVMQYAGDRALREVLYEAYVTRASERGPDAGRWDFAVTFLHEDGDESGSFPIPDPYDNPNQRSLCNKCHNQDVDDLNPF